MGSHVIVGTGITGLIGALLLRERNPRDRIVLVERESQVGGLLKSYRYEGGLVFDHGMHNFNQVGIPELDQLLWELLEDDWLVLEGPKRDLAGLYFDGRLQENSIYPDIRHFPVAERQRAVDELMSIRREGRAADFANVYAYGTTHLGPTLRERVVRPSLEKIFGHPIEKLHFTAATIAPMERVVAFDLPEMHKLQQDPSLRTCLAFTEQTQLPLQFSSGRKSYYPKKFGTWRILEAIEARLKAAKVDIMTGHTVDGLEMRDGRLSSLRIVPVAGGAPVLVEDPGTFLWTTGFPQLYKLLFGKFPADKPDPLRKTVLANLVLSRPLACGELQYFHCYDPAFRTFRVNNYANYCPAAKNPLGYPVCVEMIVDEAELTSVDLLQVAKDELGRMCGTPPGDIVFGKLEVLREAFPMPTLKNLGIIGGMRHEIKALGLANLVVAGILSEDNLFFQRHVLPDLHRKLTEAT